jgi:hypothetical protein
MGLIHPPVGLNLFVIKNIAPDIPLRDMVWGPHYVAGTAASHPENVLTTAVATEEVRSEMGDPLGTRLEGQRRPYAARHHARHFHIHRFFAFF